jgi:hypothetical protein
MPMSKEDILKVYEDRKENSEYRFTIDLAVGRLEIFADWSSGENQLNYDHFINKTDYYDGGEFMREAFEQPEDYQFEFLVFDILESYFSEDCIYKNESLYKQLREVQK